MAESYPFSSELLPYGPSIAICSSLRHSSPCLIRFAPLRIHGFKSDICMVCLGQNGHFRGKVSKYAAVWQCPALPHQIGALRPKAPQYAAARQHSSAYLATFAPLRMHRLNRTFAWCASVKTAISEGRCGNMQQYGSVLPFLTRFAPSGPQHRNMQQHGSILAPILPHSRPCGCIA